MGVPLRKLTIAEFLAWERDRPERNEFWRGDVYAMVGGKRGHGRVIANLMRHLGNQLDDTPCQAFSENMKVQVADEAVLYPDVFVTCDKQFGPDQAVFTAPILIIEVLSPSTQEYDRSRKFAIYRRLPSLREYGLIDPDTRRVEVFRLGDDGLWNLLDMSEQGEFELASIDCRIARADLFKGMESEPAGS
ncbi:Uma2 family endonuclease [Aquincola sp. S2]|uniref:Uma2 family endonuclease n=1 Tax=Pseudaquabacterium terrae TaxID=2732868 RepID=A0ABX2E9A7_9BURK|nr:Uma2 family endonuclease [Aquabacterium terrae]NRF65559.1 Uma2 family endonuclease [Aquabacterium terrae]